MAKRFFSFGSLTPPHLLSVWESRDRTLDDSCRCSWPSCWQVKPLTSQLRTEDKDLQVLLLPFISDTSDVPVTQRTADLLFQSALNSDKTSKWCRRPENMTANSERTAKKSYTWLWNLPHLTNQWQGDSWLQNNKHSRYSVKINEACDLLLFYVSWVCRVKNNLLLLLCRSGVL